MIRCWVQRSGGWLSVHLWWSPGLLIFKVVLEEFLTLKAWIRKEKKFCWDNIQKIRSMETQDNGFLLVIDGVRKEKERLTAANPLIWIRDKEDDRKWLAAHCLVLFIPSPGPILCWIISWNFPDSKNPAEVLDNRIKEEMEEEIVCNRWKDLADCC